MIGIVIGMALEFWRKLKEWAINSIEKLKKAALLAATAVLTLFALGSGITLAIVGGVIVATTAVYFLNKQTGKVEMSFTTKNINENELPPHILDKLKKQKEGESLDVTEELQLEI